MRKEIRIVLVGDSDVGKTSIIMTLLKEEFSETVEHVIAEVAIPADVTYEKVKTYIVDTSNREENREKLEHEIKKAHVICVVYSISAPETFEHVRSHWLPYIRSIGVSVPIVLVGNKIDIRGTGNQRNPELEQEVEPIMQDFKEVEVTLECSARNNFNISDLFFHASRTVFYPMAPIFDSTTSEMRPKCKSAFSRIFKLCDLDKDGFLSDKELNEFQQKVFQSPLPQHELDALKRHMSMWDKDEEGSPSVTDQGITEAGFIRLQMEFISKARLETVWRELRTFGYGDDLNLREEILYPKYAVHEDQSVELSRKGHEFIFELFEKFDKDNDGALSPSEMQNLFETAPEIPWKDMNLSQVTSCNANGWVTLKGFICLFNMMTLLDFHKTLEYLVYLGFPDVARDGIRPTSRRKEVVLSGAKIQRNVLLCYIVGASGCGKTTALRQFLRLPLRSDYIHTAQIATVVNTLEINGLEKCLVAQELNVEQDRAILRDRSKLKAADCVCFMYDSSNPESFAYIAELLTQIDFETTPCVVVATKSDRPQAAQRYEVQPDEFCARLNLSAPVSVSFTDPTRPSKIFPLIVGASLDPKSALPLRPHQRRSHTASRDTFTIVAVTLSTLAAAGSVAYFVWHWWRNSPAPLAIGYGEVEHLSFVQKILRFLGLDTNTNLK